MTTLRQLTVNDVATLRDISIETFQDTFGPYNSAEDMTTYLAKAYQTEKLRAELRNPASLFYFVMVDDEIAGYLKLNIDNAQSEPMGASSLEVERIYIRRSFQRRGLGRVFIEEAMKVAVELGKTMIWLGVWEHNSNAIAFYQKMGFRLTGESHDFYLGSDHQTDLLMARQL